MPVAAPAGLEDLPAAGEFVRELRGVVAQAGQVGAGVEQLGPVDTTPLLQQFHRPPGLSGRDRAGRRVPPQRRVPRQQMLLVALPDAPPGQQRQQGDGLLVGGQRPGRVPPGGKEPARFRAARRAIAREAPRRIERGLRDSLETPPAQPVPQITGELISRLVRRLGEDRPEEDGRGTT